MLLPIVAPVAGGHRRVVLVDRVALAGVVRQPVAQAVLVVVVQPLAGPAVLAVVQPLVDRVARAAAVRQPVAQVVLVGVLLHRVAAAVLAAAVPRQGGRVDRVVLAGTGLLIDES
jgi:hypothetical protein